MPRALVLCEFPTLNGGERSLLAVLPTLQAAGWIVDFCCPPAGPLADALRAIGVEVVAAPRDDGDRRRETAWLKILGERLRAHPYDLVHANSLSMSVTTGPVSSEFRVPTIGHIRDIARLSSAKIDRLNHHTRILAVSAAARDHFTAQGLDATKAHFLHNGINCETFHPPRAADPVSTLRREHQIPASASIIGIVGQIILRKGQDVALAAAAEVLQRRSEAHVVVVGARHSEKPETVEFEQKLHAIAAEARVADRVHFAGTRADMPGVLREFALLLHTARQEPLGRVLLEAAATGLPVVATEVGGTREIFPADEGDGAILIPADDAPAAAGALDKLLADVELRRRLGVAGRARIQAAFTAEQSAAGLLRHYTEVAAMPALEPGRIVL
jgi:glycosyltransferase involved in cell wall biosynthesis